MAKRIWMVSDSHLGCRSNSVLWLKIIEDYFFEFFIPLLKKEYKKGDTLSVSNSIHATLIGNGVAKDFVEKKSKSTKED